MFNWLYKIDRQLKNAFCLEIIYEILLELIKKMGVLFNLYFHNNDKP